MAIHFLFVLCLIIYMCLLQHSIKGFVVQCVYNQLKCGVFVILMRQGSTQESNTCSHTITC